MAVVVTAKVEAVQQEMPSGIEATSDVAAQRAAKPSPKVRHDAPAVEVRPQRRR